MRKLLFCVLAALTTLISCKEMQEFQTPNGEGITKISLGVPDQMTSVTKASAEYVNSALSGLANIANAELLWDVKIYYGASADDANLVYSWTKDNDYKATAGTAEFAATVGGKSFGASVDLVTGKDYLLVATARLNEEITPLFNDESEDFFTVEKPFKGGENLTASLTRPVGKLRLVATDYVKALALMPGKSLQAIKVEYTNSNPTITYATADINTYSSEVGTGSKTIFVDFLSAPAGEEAYYPFKVTMYFAADGATIDPSGNAGGSSSDVEEITVTVSQDIPIKPNCLTTVKGNLFTGSTNLNIEVEDGFSEENLAAKKLLSDIENVANGSTVVLLDDVTLSNTNDGERANVIAIRSMKNFTLDLNGNTLTTTKDNADNAILVSLTRDKSLTGEVTVTIKNGTIDAQGAYSAIGALGVSEDRRLTVNLENVTIKGKNIKGSIVKAWNHSTINLKAGTSIIATDSYSCVEATNQNTQHYSGYATVNIYDGVKLNMVGTGGELGSLVGASYGATANIYGGEGTSDQKGLCIYSSGATINVSGGTWSAKGNVLQADMSDNSVSTDATINVTGGSFTGGLNKSNQVNKDGFKAEINITGGTFENLDFMPFMTDNANVDVVLAKNLECDQIVTDGTQDISIDLNGKTLQLNNITQRVLGNSKLSIIDNTLSAAPAQANLIMNANEAKGKGEGACFDLAKHLGTESGASLTLKNVNCEASNSWGLILANLGTVTIDNCITNSLYYALTTNATVKEGELEYGSGAVFNVSNSTLTTTETPIALNVPVTANISNTTLNGTWQCVMMRGGTIDIKGCTLNYTRAAAFAEIESWSSGNQVPKAAITGGNKGTGAYQYPTSITIDASTTINMQGEHKENPMIYLYGDGKNEVTYSGPWGTADGSVKVGSSEKVTIK